MLQEKNNTSLTRSTKLPSIYKPSPQLLLTKIQLQHLISQPPSLSLTSSQLQLEQIHSPSFKRYDSKQNCLTRIRSIAKSNYIKCVTEQASQDLTRSRIESIQSLKKKVLAHQKQQKTIETETKKEESLRRQLEKLRVKERKKKIDEIDKLETLKKQKQEIKERINQLQNNLKLYQEYEGFCKEVIGSELRVADISEVKKDVIVRNIVHLEEMCLKECELKRTGDDEIAVTKGVIGGLKRHFEPIKGECERKIRVLRESIKGVEAEVQNFQNHLRIIQYDRSKRGPFSIIYSAAAKFLKSKNQIDYDEESVFMETLSGMEMRLDQYREEIERHKRVNLGRYNKKEYEYLLGKIHPSRSGTNDDERLVRF